MQDRIEFNQIKGVVILTLFIVLILKSICSHAQTGITHLGFHANFGTNIFGIKSNIPELNENFVSQGGGQLGLIAGNQSVKARIGLLGYYTSDGQVAGSVDLYKSGAAINFYPLAMLCKKQFRVQPYLSGGVSYDRYKFYGYYLDNDGGRVNHSVSEAPSLGAIKQVNTFLGAGIEIRLMERYDFVHFFSEARFGDNLSMSTNNTRFNQTTIASQMQFTAGLSFGVIR